MIHGLFNIASPSIKSTSASLSNKWVGRHYIVVTGSNPQQNIICLYISNLHYLCDWNSKKNENKQKEAEIGPFIKKLIK